MNQFSLAIFHNKDQQTPTHCRIETPKHIYTLALDDILFIESNQKKCTIHLADCAICVSEPLYLLCQKLPAATFLQTHRSFIVNLKQVSAIHKNGDTWAIAFPATEKQAYISRSFRHQVLQALHHL